MQNIASKKMLVGIIQFTQCLHQAQSQTHEEMRERIREVFGERERDCFGLGVGLMGGLEIYIEQGEGFC